MLGLPTEVYLQQQLCLAKLQGDVVPLLALPMENHSVALRCFEPQRNHVFNDLHLLHLHRGEETLQVSHCTFKENVSGNKNSGQKKKRVKISQGSYCGTLKRYEITPCPSKFITPAPKIKHR